MDIDFLTNTFFRNVLNKAHWPFLFICYVKFAPEDNQRS